MNINWPPRFDPKVAPIHVRNELAMDAPPAAVWAWLIRASEWPLWYSNSAAVRIDGGARDLSAGVEFRWRTFNMPLVSRVHEFVPGERIGWFAVGVGIDVYHAWLIEPRGSGCWVLTEETQYGFVSRLGKLFMPQNMSKWHQIWLEKLAQKAAGGPPAST
ncbi:MAG TPA: SRPBCC family protein [Polyangium sp.]|nr:SRPBCC family protein [Polyangium sp.]